MQLFSSCTYSFLFIFSTYSDVLICFFPAAGLPGISSRLPKRMESSVSETGRSGGSSILVSKRFPGGRKGFIVLQNSVNDQVGAEDGAFLSHGGKDISLQIVHGFPGFART